MTPTIRGFVYAIPALAFAWLGQGCSSDNSPAYNAGGTASTASGGTASSVGGSATSAGGGGATTTTTGGSSTAAGGGAAATTGGTTATNPAEFSPACGTTMAGVAVAKGGVCTATDPQLCYKTCGPGNVGFKSETCTASAYVEGTCQFPASGNYACFKVPTADAAGCPATAPQHNQPCSIGICTLPCAQTTACEMCGISAGYLDSSGASKTGYCVCIPASAGGGKWACASSTAWPCPAGQGC